MSVKNLLLWEKWRPKNLEDIILPPRIKNNFEKGVDKNYLFYGNYGTGKTSLARILIGKYSKDKAYLEINSSLHTSIDVLRSEVEKFCKTKPMMETEDPMKYVFLDEAERISGSYQDALKAFIEKYHESVRFILTTNHIGKISDGIKSRFVQVNFDTVNQEEEKYIKREFYKKISQKICPDEGISIGKDDLVGIINRKFPDLRSILLELQNFRDTGHIQDGTNVSNKLKLEFYQIITDNNSDYEGIYHFIMNNFGPEGIDKMISILESDFILWSINERRDLLESMFKFNKIVSDHKPKLETSIDPIVLGMSLIGEFRDLIYKV